YSQEASPLGTAGALRLALPLLKSESALVVNGDSFCDADLRGFWEWHRGREADASMLLVEVPDTRRYGRVSVDNEGRVIRFEEKNEEGAPGWINAGIYLIRRRLLEKLPEKQNVSLERDVFPAFLRKGLFGFQSKARFLDIGTPQSYQSASRFFHEG
ncbi:MAG: galactokinase, partial [Desulfuromonadaceae bacterium]|nr:galactokinase [Desulfuromonadaceae bacterium]